MFIEYIVGLSGLIAAGLFIYGLKAMSSLLRLYLAL